MRAGQHINAASYRSFHRRKIVFGKFVGYDQIGPHRADRHGKRLNYPIRNYINSFEDKYKLDSLSVYIGNWTINVQALQSVTCEIPVRNLRLTGFHQDKLTVGYHHAEMDSCQIEKLHLKSIAMPTNALINGKKEPSRIISFKNSHIGQLYRYKEKYVD